MWWRELILDLFLLQFNFVSSSFSSFSTTANSLSASNYSSHLEVGQFCINDCDDSPRAWCGQRKQNSFGQVLRCAQGTKYGEVCIDSCSTKGELYWWCWTNSNDKVSDYWETCGINDGLTVRTVNGGRCRTECQQAGQSYFWCFDRWEDPHSWDYCSPPGQVHPVQYTRHGQACIGKCKITDDEKPYWWCHKARRWGSSQLSSEDSWWEYCSPTSSHTRYGEPCVEECASSGLPFYKKKNKTKLKYIYSCITFISLVMPLVTQVRTTFGA